MLINAHVLQCVYTNSDLLKYVVQKLQKRYCPDSLVAEGQGRQGDRDDGVRQTKADIRSARNCHDILVKCTFLDPRFKRDLKENNVVSARSQLIIEFADAQPAQQFENGTRPNLFRGPSPCDFFFLSG